MDSQASSGTQLHTIGICINVFLHISKLSYLENLMDRVDPGLNEHFKAEQVQYNFFAYRWINCFLMRELSLPLIVRGVVPVMYRSTLRQQRLL